MLRRMRDQADHGSQFYLYRVLLMPSVVVREGWLIDPSDFVGDVVLDEVCPPGVDVARYLNYHEDPGGLSLALGRGAIASVQQVAVPLPDACDNDWVREAVAALDGASDAPSRRPTGLADSFGRRLRELSWAASSVRLWPASCRSTSRTSSRLPLRSTRVTTRCDGLVGRAVCSI